MKVYKVELMILDFEEMGPDEIKSVIENTKYPNWCISPNVMNIEGRDIGEWDDDHPLNKSDTMKEEYHNLFGK